MIALLLPIISYEAGMKATVIDFQGDDAFMVRFFPGYEDKSGIAFLFEKDRGIVWRPAMPSKKKGTDT